MKTHESGGEKDAFAPPDLRGQNRILPEERARPDPCGPSWAQYSIGEKQNPNGLPKGISWGQYSIVEKQGPNRVAEDTSLAPLTAGAVTPQGTLGTLVYYIILRVDYIILRIY